MKKEIKTTEIFCDVCGKPCTENNKNRKLYLGGDNNVSNYIYVKIYYYGSYATNDGDVCNKCAVNALEKIIEEMNLEIKK